MNQRVDMAHVLGWFALGAILFAAVGVSAVLSSIFFVSISPPDKPWMVYLFLSLTEIGMVAWLLVFFLMRHHPFHKSVAIVMACAHGLTSFVIAGYELDSLIFSTDAGNHGASLSIVGTTLLAIFGLDLLAVFVDVIARYFERPGHEFRLKSECNYDTRNLIPSQTELNYGHRNLIPSQTVTPEEESRPLALPVPRDSREPIMETIALPSIKEVGSTLMRKARNSIRHGKQEALVPGDQNTNTNASGYPGANIRKKKTLPHRKKRGR